METWQRTHQGELSCLHMPITVLCNAIVNTCQMPSHFYILPMWIQAKHRIFKTIYSTPFYGRPYSGIKCCFGVFIWTGCTRHPHMLSLPSHCEKFESWQQESWVKTAEKSWMVTEFGHVTLNCVQMASKQAKVAFLSYFFQGGIEKQM